MEATYEHRTYRFTTNFASAERVTVTAYNTEYTFVQKNGEWQNASSNKNDMAKGLIDTIIKVVFADVPQKSGSGS